MKGNKTLVQALRRLKVETGSLACVGCGHEHNCGIHGCAIIREAAERLSAYEDTGLTPEVCTEYRKFEDEIIASGKTFGRLIELLRADKEERVVMLPCKMDKTMIDLTFPERPMFMKRISLAVSYEHKGHLYHMGYDTFAGLVKRGQIKPVEEETENAVRRVENGNA